MLIYCISCLVGKNRNSVVQNGYLVSGWGLQLARPVSGGCKYGGLIHRSVVAREADSPNL